MNNREIAWNLKTGFLILFSTTLLLAGGALLYRQATLIFSDDINQDQHKTQPITVTRTVYKSRPLHGAFPTDSVQLFSYQHEGKTVFDLLLANYRDNDNKPGTVILFPESDDQQVSASSSQPLNPAVQRAMIWQTAAKSIREKAPKSALFLSWWDDGQRIRFLGNRDVWLTNPGKATFTNPVWQGLHDHLILAADRDVDRLPRMAKWLTMDSNNAIAEMRKFFGTKHSLYLLVTNDLLLRIGELTDYGGKPISLRSTRFPVSSNLHGDIANIKRWAYENSDGNYLVQKEGAYYRAWITTAETGNNSLLVRLLPFVDSLKKLPSGVELVYQSQWGSYLSIYELDFNAVK